MPYGDIIGVYVGSNTQCLNTLGGQHSVFECSSLWNILLPQGFGRLRVIIYAGQNILYRWEYHLKTFEDRMKIWERWKDTKD